MSSHEYRVVAYNTATASSNTIHDGTVARQYSFTGALVPGVDVHAYMTRRPGEAWGVDWLRGGSMRARFITPVYDGETVTVVATPIAGADGELAVTSGAQRVRTCVPTGEARMPAEPIESVEGFPVPAPRHPGSRDRRRRRRPSTRRLPETAAP